MATKKAAKAPAPPPAPDKNAGKAPTSTRALWKGSISFGLVHVPVSLFSATEESDLSFKMIDKRTMDPVGYKRINKKSGKEVAMADVVKGVKWDDGRYVILSPDEVEAAFPRTTQTIEIEAFIPIDQIPFVYLEKPYYTAPINKGQKVYALLREALAETRQVGVAKVVISTKQHLALLMPCGPALVLNLLRWGGEIRSFDALQLPPMGAKEAGIKESELAMARQLISEMSADWTPQRFQDSFHDEIMKLVEAKVEAGEYQEVEKVEGAPETGPGNVVDLTELLMRSIRKPAAPKAAPADKKAPAKKTPARKAA